jgi:hypothetical protein
MRTLRRVGVSFSAHPSGIENGCRGIKVPIDFELLGPIQSALEFSGYQAFVSSGWSSRLPTDCIKRTIRVMQQGKHNDRVISPELLGQFEHRKEEVECLLTGAV